MDVGSSAIPDAHYLEDIHEPELTIEAGEKSIQGIVDCLLRPIMGV